ncbi:MAG: glycine betaine ABC transporter ATP-binding protein [Clostridia bacterium BRH_c25]|nr:MAG: glycine betaine ABC transporter ATP-binding protein [Clostridia bacterium BRH_c25]
MIRFENVTKKYGSKDKPAVDNLDLHIEEGEICILVGPSGCGKTTTMKMINRLIKQTSGKIFIGGKDIDAIDPIKLRLGIGYVIQGIGLFPHMTIEDNIATVPLEKGWDKQRISKRVDELLELVELAPDEYRKKRPSNLSGGQKQRVGVARALAADPPVMLMDEPFGALDPITRSRLQNEFLHIQEKLKKTIVFVTHDIDEAIKMGDKIAVMRDGNIVQFGTPYEILSNPADEFVSDLIGGNSTLKMMHLITCEKAMRVPFVVSQEEEIENILQSAQDRRIKILAVTDSSQRLVGFAEYKNLVNHHGKIGSIMKKVTNTVDVRMTLQDALSEMFSFGSKFVFVADHQRKVKGILNIDDLLKAVSEDEKNTDAMA